MAVLNLQGCHLLGILMHSTKNFSKTKQTDNKMNFYTLLTTGSLQMKDARHLVLTSPIPGKLNIQAKLNWHDLIFQQLEVYLNRK